MMPLPDLRSLTELQLDKSSTITGISGIGEPEIARQLFDRRGLWWAVPFASGESGCDYAFRLAPGPEHGAVLRCLNGHAVTIASSPDRAIFAIVAIERLLVGQKSRAKLHDGWAQARGALREAVAITGGDPDALDDVLHLADALPKWTQPAPAVEEENRRTMLWRITGESGAEPAWARSRDSRVAPDDAAASLRLLQGNHGLDATHAGAGLFPNHKLSRELVIACARGVRAGGLEPDPAWAAVITAIADREQPTPDDFIPASVGVGAARAWDSLAAASFWFNAVGGMAPPEHATVAEEIAEAAGAQHVLEARKWPREGPR